MNFEWDNKKAHSNFEKHKVRFEIAVKVFLDDYAMTSQDLRHDYGEYRYITYGCIDERLYAMVYTINAEKSVTRIISARKANARERRRYVDNKVHD